MRNPDYLRLVRSHCDKLLANGLDVYGDRLTAMWMASLDTRTGRYPEDDARPSHISKRVYRNIDAPRGCSLYWDQPAVVAAHFLSALTGEALYAAAADAYVRDFIEACVAPTGVFLWGNHYYYDAFRDAPVRFIVEEAPVPCDRRTETGDLHEMRPLPGAWDAFRRVAPAETERAIRMALAGHVVDARTGEFQRHAAGESGCAFLEAGGILVESAAWLFAKTHDAWLIETASRVAAFSFRHRNESTGLLENNPTQNRWDKFTATSEVGLWANCLFRASKLADVDDWADMAADAIGAWSTHAWDAGHRRFHGRLRVADGTPILEEKTTPYQPGDYCGLWEPLFPTHDYPMAAAEASLSAFERTGREAHLDVARRWCEVIRGSLPARNGRGAYAEHYARCIHFLMRLGETAPDAGAGELARRVADEAVSVLFAHDMFRGHPGEDRYDAVDGVGFLLLALLQLQTGETPDMMGLGW